MYLKYMSKYVGRQSQVWSSFPLTFSFIFFIIKLVNFSVIYDISFLCGLFLLYCLMYFIVVDGETPAQSAEEMLKLATQIEEKVLRKISYLNSEVSYN